MKFRKHFDESNLYECPMCKNETLTIHDHGEAECSSCDFKRTVKTHKCKDLNTTELHIEVDGDIYKFKPRHMKDLTDDEKICVVENNELICVAKSENIE